MYLCKILAGDHADASGEILVEDRREVEEEHQQHEVVPEASPGVDRRHPLAEVDVPNRDEERRAKGAEKVAPAPITSAPPTTAVFTPEQVTNTLRDLVTAVQGLHLNQYHHYMAGPYAPPPVALIAAYGHPMLSWPSQGAPAYSGQLSVSKLADLG